MHYYNDMNIQEVCSSLLNSWGISSLCIQNYSKLKTNFTSINVKGNLLLFYCYLIFFFFTLSGNTQGLLEGVPARNRGVGTRSSLRVPSNQNHFMIPMCNLIKYHSKQGKYSPIVLSIIPYSLSCWMLNVESSLKHESYISTFPRWLWNEL